MGKCCIFSSVITRQLNYFSSRPYFGFQIDGILGYTSDQCRNWHPPTGGPPSRNVGPPYHVANVQSGFWGEHWTSEGVKTFFLVFTRCLGENWTSGPRKIISGGGHALSSFGPASDGQLVLEAKVNRFL